jgi:hypothetical protein
MLDTEPVLTTAGVVAALAALLAVIVAFGVPLSQTQTEAILALAAVAGPLAAAAWGRTKAFSPATVRAIKEQP